MENQKNKSAEIDSSKNQELKVKPLASTFDDIEQPDMVSKWRLPKLHFKLLACGPSGSGKSTAVINLLNLAYTKSFKKVFLIGPTSKVDKVWDSLTIDNFNSRSRKEKISIDELKQMFSEGLRSVKRNGHTGPKTLIIFEDFINTVDPHTGKLLLNSHEVADLTLVGRHAAISLIFLTQLYNKLPRRIRENCSHVIFLPAKQGENERMADDFCPPRRSKKWMLELIMEVTKPDANETHPFLFVDVHSEPEYKFRRNFDLLVDWSDDSDRKTMGSLIGKAAKDQPQIPMDSQTSKQAGKFQVSSSASSSSSQHTIHDAVDAGSLSKYGPSRTHQTHRNQKKKKKMKSQFYPEK